MSSRLAISAKRMVAIGLSIINIVVITLVGAHAVIDNLSPGIHPPCTQSQPNTGSGIIAASLTFIALFFNLFLLFVYPRKTSRLVLVISLLVIVSIVAIAGSWAAMLGNNLCTP